MIPEDEQQQRRARRSPAHMVWLCGICDSETSELNDGSHLCETCGSLFGARGEYVPAEEDES